MFTLNGYIWDECMFCKVIKMIDSVISPLYSCLFFCLVLLVKAHCIWGLYLVPQTFLLDSFHQKLWLGINMKVAMGCYAIWSRCYPILSPAFSGLTSNSQHLYLLTECFPDGQYCMKARSTEESISTVVPWPPSLWKLLDKHPSFLAPQVDQCWGQASLAARIPKGLSSAYTI